MLLRIVSLMVAAVLLTAPARAQEGPPHPDRELRAVWIATVANIDFPSAPGNTTELQKSELIKLLDRAASLHLNAVYFQVRPQCDALYASPLEPWSGFLTGQMGRGPEPVYDPLAFAVAEAHRRGLELHAWFNPYRALHPGSVGPISDDHIAHRRPDLVRSYGKFLWLDPGEPEVQSTSLAVVLDVARRYDVDGIHFDDYFYPYPENDPDGQPLPFPDDHSWDSYRAGGGSLDREDWRRQNVDSFVLRVSQSLKSLKPYLKFSISPFGIWRPGQPAQIQGLDSYAKLYADSRRWLREGWVDDLIPQLYWEIGRTAQSYPVLLDWWQAQNVAGRHVFAGNALFKIGTSASYTVDEILAEIRLSRQTRTPGNVFFSAKVLMADPSNLNERMVSELYSRPALTPQYPWLAEPAPQPPTAVLASPVEDGFDLSWNPSGSRVRQRIIYVRENGSWRWDIVPGSSLHFHVAAASAKDFWVGVSNVGRTGMESDPTTARIGPRWFP